MLSLEDLKKVVALGLVVSSKDCNSHFPGCFDIPMFFVLRLCHSMSLKEIEPRTYRSRVDSSNHQHMPDIIISTCLLSYSYGLKRKKITLIVLHVAPTVMEPI